MRITFETSVKNEVKNEVKNSDKKKSLISELLYVMTMQQTGRIRNIVVSRNIYEAYEKELSVLPNVGMNGVYFHGIKVSVAYHITTTYIEVEHEQE